MYVHRLLVQSQLENSLIGRCKSLIYMLTLVPMQTAYSALGDFKGVFKVSYERKVSLIR